MAINKHNFWDVNYYKHPELTERMVRKAEKKLGLTLPPELIELLMVQNGGYTIGFAYPMTKRTSWAEDHVPLSELFGIVDESFKTAQNILSTPDMTTEWGLPDRQVLLCGDGHFWITLDYRHGPIPSVRWIDTELKEDIHVADTFKSFLDGLVSDEKFSS